MACLSQCQSHHPAAASPPAGPRHTPHLLHSTAGRSAETEASAYFREHERTSLLQRFLQPDEVAAVVAFLASPAASGINGSALRVEGGIIRHL